VRFKTKEMYLILFRLLKRVSKIDIHSLQVACVSKIVGRELGFSKHRLNVVGFLHDIGLLNPGQVNRFKELSVLKMRLSAIGWLLTVDFRRITR